MHALRLRDDTEVAADAAERERALGAQLDADAPVLQREAVLDDAAVGAREAAARTADAEPFLDRPVLADDS